MPMIPQDVSSQESCGDHAYCDGLVARSRDRDCPGVRPPSVRLHTLGCHRWIARPNTLCRCHAGSRGTPNTLRPTSSGQVALE